MLSKCINGHWSTCMVVNSDLLVPIYTQSHQLPFQEWPSVHVIHKLSDANPIMSATNLKQHINLYLNLANLPVSTFDSLTWPPPPKLPFFPLEAPTNTWSVYVYSWWKPQCWLKAPHILSFLWAISATRMSINMSQVGVTLFPSF